MNTNDSNTALIISFLITTTLISWLLWSTRTRAVQHRQQILHRRGILHIKGFVQHLGKYKNKILDKILHQVKEIQPHTIVWDGDDLHEDSFTDLLKTVVDHHPVQQIIAYVPKHPHPFDKREPSAKEHVQKQWANVHPNFIVRDVDLPVDKEDDLYHALGSHAIRDTGANIVITIGGGDCVYREILTAPPGVEFRIIDVEIPGKKRLWSRVEDQPNCILLYKVE
jgi:hypothetical protein